MPFALMKNLTPGPNKTTQIMSYVLLAGLSVFLSGFFWQTSSTRLQTMYYLLVVLPVFLTLPYQIKIYPFNRIFALSSLLILYTALSVFWSDDTSTEALFHQFKKILLLLSLFFAIYTVNNKFPKFEDTILKVMLLCGSMLAIYNIMTLLMTDGISGRSHGWGVLNNANVSAEVLGLLLLYAFREFLKSEHRKVMSIYFPVLLVLAIEIILNKSRGQQFALFIGIILVLFSVERENLKKLIPIALITIMSLIFLALFTDITDKVLNRELNLSCRDVIWKELLTTAFNTPYFGRGAGSSSGFEAYCKAVDSTYTHPHSVYMAVFLYTGITGVLLGLWLTTRTLLTAYHSGHEKDIFWAIIIIYGFIAFLPNGDGLVSRPNEIWMLFWIPVAFIASRPP
jgi:hypothetical protein